MITRVTDKKILILPGCDSCATGKKNGMCEENNCVSTNTSLGKKIEKEANVKKFPECVVQKQNKKWSKCNVQPILKKYVDKKI